MSERTSNQYSGAPHEYEELLCNEDHNLSLGIIIPAYKPDIEKLTTYVHAIREQLAPETIRIELDATQSKVPEVLSDLPASIHVATYRRGKGAAITDGFEALDTDILAFLDADGSTLIKSFANVIEPVHNGQADIAIGSRRHPEATVFAHQTIVRRHLGNVFVRLAQRLISPTVYDYQCGAKVISADAWSDVRPYLHESEFAWDIELIAIAVALNKQVAEVPVEWIDHPNSTVSPLADSIRMLQGLLMARHRSQIIQGDRFHTLLNRFVRDSALVDRVPNPPALFEEL